MSNEVMSLASEILSMDEMTKAKVRKILKSEYGASDEMVSAVILVLEGEGYWG